MKFRRPSPIAHRLSPVARARGNGSSFNLQPSTFNLVRAFTLIEILLAVTMLGFIMLGLMSMFSFTQRAFRGGMTQTDVLEAGRATMSLVSGEFEAATPSHIGSVVNFSMTNHPNFYSFNALPGVTPNVGARVWRTNVLEQAFFLVQENKKWYGIGYVVAVPTPLMFPYQFPYGFGYMASNQVGTLYRFQYPPPGAGTNNPSSLYTNFLAAAYNAVFDPFLPNTAAADAADRSNARNISTNLHRIADGVVHFRVLAYNATNALIVSPGIGSAIKAETNQLTFTGSAVPAYLDLELGVLESQTFERFKALININAPLATRYQPARDYFQRRAANIQLFRRHVAVRNVDPEAYP